MSEPPYEDEPPPYDEGYDDELPDDDEGSPDYEPLLYQDYFDAFEDMVGTTGRASSYSGGDVAGAYEWIEIFESTGISTGSRDGDVEAFEMFLMAFYPQDKNSDDWWLDREEFYEIYGIDDYDIDWEAYREAIDSP